MESQGALVPETAANALLPDNPEDKTCYWCVAFVQ